MKLLVWIVNSLKLLTVFGKNSILDVWLGSEYACAFHEIINKKP